MSKLANSYRIFANDGQFSEITFCKGLVEKKTKTIFSAGTTFLISEILRSHAFADSDLKIAWKSGTSSSLHDAWCFAWSPDYTVGVWFGNKNGVASPSLIGVSSAVPAAAEIFDCLYQEEEKPSWQLESVNLETCELCQETGLKKTSSCKNKFIGMKIKNIPLAECRQCSNLVLPQIQILSPRNNLVYATDSSSAKIFLSVISPENMSDIFWYVDGEAIGQNKTSYDFKIGHHTVYAVLTTKKGDHLSATASFSVVPAVW